MGSMNSDILHQLGASYVFFLVLLLRLVLSIGSTRLITARAEHLLPSEGYNFFCEAIVYYRPTRRRKRYRSSSRVIFAAADRNVTITRSDRWSLIYCVESSFESYCRKHMSMQGRLRKLLLISCLESLRRTKSSSRIVLADCQTLPTWVILLSIDGIDELLIYCVNWALLTILLLLFEAYPYRHSQRQRALLLLEQRKHS